MPGIHGALQRLAFGGQAEIDDRCCSPECSGNRSALKIIGGDSSAKGHIEMGVGINPPGKYITAGGVYDFSIRSFQIQADSGHNPVLNQDVSCISVRCGNDNAIFDDLLHHYTTSASEYEPFKPLITRFR
ncbi:hypothetical protein D3C75_1131170 [compost metagenome]